MPYKVMTLLATDALDVSMPHLYASMSYAEWTLIKAGGEHILNLLTQF